MQYRSTITEVIESIRSDRANDPTRVQKQDFDSEAHLILESQTHADSVIRTFERGDTLSPAEFFKNLVELSWGLNDAFEIEAALILLAKLRCLEIQDRATFLSEGVFSEGSSFWHLIDTLIPSVKNLRFSPSELLLFFQECAVKASKDMAGGRVYRLFDFIADLDPDCASQMLSLLAKRNSISDEDTTIAIHLLGKLRANETASDLDRSFRESELTAIRKCHHWSHLVYFDDTANEQALRDVFDPIFDGDQFDREQGLIVLIRLLRTFEESDVLPVLIQWIDQKAQGAVTDSAKHDFFDQTLLLLFRTRSKVPDLASLVAKLADHFWQIPTEHVGTWERAVEWLGQILKLDDSAFINALANLADSNGLAALNHLKESQALQGLAFELGVNPQIASKILAQLIFCDSADRREIGIRLFNKSKIAELDGDSVELSPSLVELAILQHRSAHRSGEHTSRFYCAIEPYASLFGETKQMLSEAARWEAHNWYNECHEVWKARGDKNPLLAAVARSVEEYYSGVDSAYSAKTLVYEMPDTASAAVLIRRRDQRMWRDAGDKAMENSFLSALAPTTTLIYGTSFSFRTPEGLSERQDFTKHSTSVSLPRNPIIDPEGDFILRHHIRARIAEIEKGIGNEREE